MGRPNYLEQIKTRIAAEKPGAVFIPCDFFDIAEAPKVNMALKRLTDTGELHRIIRGVYDKPIYSELLGEYSVPHVEKVAQALARNYGWKVVPYGDTALNLLGLSTQVPTVWLYVSTGSYKIYEIGNTKLQFKHTNRYSEISGLSYETALVIQALKAIGKDNLTEKDTRKLAGKLNRKTKDQMLTEGQYATAWVYEYIRRICTEEHLYKGAMQ